MTDPLQPTGISILSNLPREVDAAAAEAAADRPDASADIAVAPGEDLQYTVFSDGSIGVRRTQYDVWSILPAGSIPLPSSTIYDGPDADAGDPT